MAVEEGFSWRTDKRLRQVSKVRLTEDQVAAFLMAITAPVLVVFAEGGIVPKQWHEQRLNLIANHQSVTLEGHHHFHCEPACVSVIAKELDGFYTKLGYGE